MQHRIEIVINALIEITEGFVKVLTFGTVTPGWSFRFITWRTRAKIEERKRQETT